MALHCQVQLSSRAYAAGQTPPPTASILVVNSGAAAVSVTGAVLTARSPSDSTDRRVPIASNNVPTGPGLTTSVPAGSSITLGPFALAVASAANANQNLVSNTSLGARPVNVQPAMPPTRTVIIGAVVQGSDGSTNYAGELGMLVSFPWRPNGGSQGGTLNFSVSTNFLTLSCLGAL